MPMSSIILLLSDILIFKEINCYGYHGLIAGNKAISDCLNGEKSKYSDLNMTPSEFIQENGYPAEDHLILTKDGYLLTLNRIPGPKNAPAVILQHGYSATSFDWVILGKKKGLAFLLAKEGYDVWLPNARGGIFSLCHVNYTSSEYSFWDFSFHEVGMYDLPAVITYISKIIDSDIYFVGHSMGTTSFYIMGVRQPETASKVKAMYSLAPVAYMNHVRGITRLVTKLANPVQSLIKKLSAGEINEPGLLQNLLTQELCGKSLVNKRVCLFFIFSAVGFNYSQVNYTLYPLLFELQSPPSSFKTAVHYAQIIDSKKFREYNYGIIGNLKKYLDLIPPEYDLSKLQVPIGFFWAENDYYSSPQDVQRLYDVIPNKILYHKIKDPKFNHIDYIYGTQAPELVYKELINAIKNYQNNK
ncbi:lipase 3-like [Phymastichus coffea]|uniref:lipase 3-like n=1 Tax=Phymastichus coffea TaxID=108790 RepID=UPI00273C4455|nr:lipase 3-like [Phymastichus coffea]